LSAAKALLSTESPLAKTVARVDFPLAGKGRDATALHALETLRTKVIPPVLATLPAGTQEAFRSIVIPIKAIVLNLLSVGAAYGILVWIFQEGHLQGLLGFHSNGAVVTWLPLFLFTVLFGLSMDYHVFILSRVKELVDRGVPTDEAVARGIRSTASTVTSAAAVMVAVFAIFRLPPHARHQADGRRARRRSAARRHPDPRGAAAGGDEAARRLELVPAPLARVAAATDRGAGAARGDSRVPGRARRLMSR
jgi:hypothetical protein